MAMTPSTMRLALGSPAPDFRLREPSGKIVSLADFAGARALVVMFICNHCPFVVHIGRELGLLTQRWSARGLTVVAVNSNDTDAYPDDAPERMAPTARSFGWDFPYLVDTGAKVAEAFRAACTPDFFLFDGTGTLTYRGRFDAARPGNDIPVTGSDLRAAVNAVFDGAPPPAEQLPSMGCNIKWPVGREPNWLG